VARTDELRGEPLLEQRMASDAALDLAARLRGDGRPAESGALCRRALDELERWQIFADQFWYTALTARLSVALGSSLSDENRPDEAERELERAHARLEELERTLRDRRRQEAGDDARGLEAFLEQLGRLRAGALVALAVNANVRRGEPARALEYFERAYALDQSEFMKVLLACYRARSGRAEVLYNLACTHALLGERETALDYLERELAENHGSPGSLARQREWARGDPDLASLRGDARFERLLGR
jgi:tetratricopeptide (TPR) repeat protein